MFHPFVQFPLELQLQIISYLDVFTVRNLLLASPSLQLQTMIISDTEAPNFFGSLIYAFQLTLKTYMNSLPEPCMVLRRQTAVTLIEFSEPWKPTEQVKLWGIIAKLARNRNTFIYMCQPRDTFNIPAHLTSELGMQCGYALRGRPLAATWHSSYCHPWLSSNVVHATLDISEVSGFKSCSVKDLVIEASFSEALRVIKDVDLPWLMRLQVHYSGRMPLFENVQFGDPNRHHKILELMETRSTVYARGCKARQGFIVDHVTREEDYNESALRFLGNFNGVHLVGTPYFLLKELLKDDNLFLAHLEWSETVKFSQCLPVQKANRFNVPCPLNLDYLSLFTSIPGSRIPCVTGPKLRSLHVESTAPGVDLNGILMIKTLTLTDEDASDFEFISVTGNHHVQDTIEITSGDLDAINCCRPRYLSFNGCKLGKDNELLTRYKFPAIQRSRTDPTWIVGTHPTYAPQFVRLANVHRSQGSDDRLKLSWFRNMIPWMQLLVLFEGDAPASQGGRGWEGVDVDVFPSSEVKPVVNAELAPMGQRRNCRVAFM